MSRLLSAGLLLLVAACGPSGGTGAAAPAHERGAAAAPPRVAEIEIPDASAEPEAADPVRADDAGAEAVSRGHDRPAFGEDPCAHAHLKGIPCEDAKPRDVAGISMTFTRARPRFRQCYEAERRHRPQLTAKLTVRVGIDEKGVVRAATDEGSPNPDPALLGCILKVARSLRFEPASNESSVVFPLSFAP